MVPIPEAVNPGREGVWGGGWKSYPQMTQMG
jgi:hypothetical protein